MTRRNSKGQWEAISFENRFSYAISPTGCWEYTGSVSGNGYGQISVDGKMRLAHRVAAHLWLNFALEDKRLVLHRCDNKICVNPTHLMIGTYRDNNVDCSDKGRYPNQAKRFCVRGHEYSEANTAWYRQMNGRRHRVCRICEKIYNRRKYEKTKMRQAGPSNG